MLFEFKSTTTVKRDYDRGCDGYSIVSVAHLGPGVLQFSHRLDDIFWS